jgi:hypothetical protein
MAPITKQSLEEIDFIPYNRETRFIYFTNDKTETEIIVDFFRKDAYYVSLQIENDNYDENINVGKFICIKELNNITSIEQIQQLIELLK